MPFIDERRSIQNLSNIAGRDEAVLDPSMLETFGASFRSGNVITSFLTSRGMPDPNEIEQDFDAIDYVKDDPKFSPYVEDFAGIFNRKAADAKKQQILREEQDRRTREAAGAMGVVADLAAGLFDAPTLFPFGGAIMGAGRGVGNTAFRVGIGAGLDAAVSETALQATQATRTGEETALNIGGSIVLGGALGALVGRYFTPSEAGALSKKIEAQGAAFEEVDQTLASFSRAASAGAAARDAGPLTLRDENIIKRLPGINMQDPLIRLQLSELDEAKGTVRGLAETPLEYEENALGVATEIGGSVETRMKMWNAPLANTLQNIDTHYARYFNAAPEVNSIQRRLSPARAEFDRLRGKTDKMTYREFKQEVAKAAFSGGEHQIPEVRAAAAEYRAIDDMMKQRAIEAGLFPEDVAVAGDVSHLFRMYNREKIIAERGEFSRILNDYFLRKRDELARAESAAARTSGPESGKGRVDLDAMGIRVKETEKDHSIEIVLSDEVAEEAGYLKVRKVGSDYIISRLSLEPHLQGKGVAVELYERLNDAVRDRGGVLLSDTDVSDDAIRVYEALGRRGYNVERVSQKIQKEEVLGMRMNYAQDGLPIFRVTGGRPEASRQAPSRPRDAVARRAAEKAEEFSRLTDGEINAIVDETINTILGNTVGRLPYDSIVSGPRGPLKERLLRIESGRIQDFLELDIEQILRAQVRTMSADVELARKFGSPDLAEQIRKINDEADARIAQAATPKERQKIEGNRKAAIRDVEAIRDRLRGQYALPDNPDGIVLRAGRVIRNLNYVRLLGGMTISAIPDMAKPVFTYGLTKTFRDGFAPLVTNYKAFRLAAEEVKAAGTALDMVLDSRAMALADVSDDFGRHSKFERGLQAMSSRFGLVSLMAPWNAAAKQFTGMITMTNLLRTIQKAADGTATPKEIRMLGASSIDAETARRIAAQYRKYGDKQGSVLLAKAGDWDDAVAREAFRAAVVRDVDRVIVTPGQDKPLWMSTELGKTVGQFRSFGVASIQRTTLAGLQQRDAATLNGILSMLALGALTYKLKMDAAGKETSDDMAVWAVEAFDRSGLIGWLMEVNNASEKITRGTVGLSAITGEQVSRYASRNATASLLGPTLGTVQDILDVTGSLVSGDFQKSDARKLRQLIPAQNLFYLRGLFNTVEAAAIEDLPGK